MSIDINPASTVARNVRYFGDVVAIRYAGGDLTHRALDDRAARFASVLAAGGASTAPSLSPTPPLTASTARSWSRPC
ncbi:hypothetical protein ACJ5H2_22185 (plasmid) [Nocardioides sp. R1-1]|uniref:hypothetical protein n=1 Tax=Nocardioides sp. R1-1 TaxID=3383502 RepID=UPI0038D12955